MTSPPRPPLTYRAAGVDIDAGEALVERIKRLARRATRPEVVAGVGGFAGLARLPGGLREPLLVAGTDGVGTKLKTAFATGRHETIGIDLVAMCVNDVAVVGAEPLFFLDYLATGRLDVGVAEAIVGGIVEGCTQAGCALLGGETAELPGMYAPGEYDLAGFCVGVVEASAVRDGRDLRAGDVLLGLGSSGLHSNGHALARKALLEVLGLGYDDRPPQLGGASVADELLRPTRIYVTALRALLQGGVAVRGAAHITGGGIVDNLPRIVPEGRELSFYLDRGSWPVPPIFELIQTAGVPVDDWHRTFNLGLGLIVAIAAEDAERALELVTAVGERGYVVGEVRAEPGPAQVFFSVAPAGPAGPGGR